ncbi:MAG: hypothetical protein IIC00_07490 [Planctomycetes bacterium]|nr:hypothetical protein [Planctomycetota bacterium]
MSKVEKLVVICAVVGLIVAASGTAQANWSESFNGDDLDLATWQFLPYPDMTKTFTATIKAEPDGNKYLSLDETTSFDTGAGSFGSAFGAGFGSDEVFTDVRVGAIVNVTGDASRNYCGLLARATYIIDDGSISGAPGMFATAVYIMHIDWEDGPANLEIDIEKVVNMGNIMRNEEELLLDIAVPGLNHARSYYAELDVVGSGPVYVTGSLYEYKGGPLVAKTATMVDTNGNDPWEDEAVNDAPFTSGQSGIFAQNEDAEPAGYHTTFDDVFSVSDGPAAVNPSPADGATDVSVNANFSWVEAEFATSRELWLGKAGAMEKVEPAPAGTTFDPGALELDQTYQWRVDQIGPSGTVTGRTWTFTAGECMSVEDFDSYADVAGIRAAWIENIADFDYVFLATDSQGNNSMRFEFQNQYEPYFTEATRTFNSPQDWTAQGVQALSLSFVGERENMEHLMYLKLEDAAGNSFKAEHPYTHACQSDIWRQWTVALEQFSNGGVDLSSVKKITIGLGDGTSSAQVGEDKDHIYIDQIQLCPARCINVEQVDLRGDINGDCKVDIEDLIIIMDNWLNEGLSADL